MPPISSEHATRMNTRGGIGTVTDLVATDADKGTLSAQ
jgi:hypothetical protein